MAAIDIDYSNVAVTLHLRVVECRTSGVGVVNRSGLPWKQKFVYIKKMLYSKYNWYPLFPFLLQLFKHALSFIILNENSYKNKLMIK